MTFDAEPLTLAAKAMSVPTRPLMKTLARTCAKDLQDLKAAIESAS